MVKALPPQHIIGLTGNIASGKTTVAHILQDLGAEVIDADELAHEVLDVGTTETAAVFSTFGDGVAAPTGAVDRAALGQIVFADPQALAALEGIVHPSVRARIREQLARSSAQVAVVEAIKLLEGPLAHEVDSIWVVAAPRALRRQRLTHDRAMDPTVADARLDGQPPEEDKIGRADLVIHNDGSPRALRSAVEAAWYALLQQLAAGEPEIRI